MGFDVDLDNGVTLAMVHISGGRFAMGSERKESWLKEEPVHPVTVSDFYMGKYPVTQAQYKAVMRGNNPSKFEGDNLPVENVSWDEAEQFCDRLPKRQKEKYRLPSEAEWEYACRAGTTTPFHYGESLAVELDNGKWRKLGNCQWNDAYGRTKEVGSFRPNDFGLYDMHGNVGEWCQDVWHKSYMYEETGFWGDKKCIKAPTNGSAWTEDGDDSYRVWRGGSWYHLPKECRSAFRESFCHTAKLSYIGFRLVWKA